MKIITTYQCEICNEVHENEEDALNCEAKGKAKAYPRGMIFGTSFCGKKMVFCIDKIYREGHHVHYSAWACRDTEAGDNFGGKEYCGFNSWDCDITPPNKSSEAYKRMLKGLMKLNIKPVNYRKGII